jgi:hypothetical protein
MFSDLARTVAAATPTESLGQSAVAEQSQRFLNALVDFIRNPDALPESETNALGRVLGRLLEDKFVPAMMDIEGHLPAVAFVVDRPSTPEAHAMVVLPWTFSDMVREDVFALLGNTVNLASQARDFVNGRFFQDDWDAINERARAYEANALLTLLPIVQGAGRPIQLVGYQHELLQEFPSGLQSMPPALEYRSEVDLKTLKMFADLEQRVAATTPRSDLDDAGALAQGQDLFRAMVDFLADTDSLPDPDINARATQLQQALDDGATGVFLNSTNSHDAVHFDVRKGPVGELGFILLHRNFSEFAREDLLQRLCEVANASSLSRDIIDGQFYKKGHDGLAWDSHAHSAQALMTLLPILQSEGRFLRLSRYQHALLRDYPQGVRTPQPSAPIQELGSR